MSTFQKFQKHLFTERKVALARPTVELSHEESIPSAIERDNLRLEEIQLRLKSAVPTDTGWPIQPDERRALESEASAIRGLHVWYAKTRDRLFSMSTGPLDTVFVMRMDSSAPDTATAERLRVLEEAAGVAPTPERERTGTKEIWLTCQNRAADLVSRISMFAGMLITAGYIPADHGVELRPPEDVRGDAIREAQLAEYEAAAVIRRHILDAVEKFAADRAYMPGVSEEIAKRTYEAVARADALALYNHDIGNSGQGLTVDFLKSWAKKCASKGLLPKHISLPGLGDLWVATR